MMAVTVCYATPQKQVELSVEVEDNSTVARAIRRSGVCDLFPEVQLGTAIVGIHSKKVALDAPLREGDRIEIYRPLVIDPKQARLLRAQKSAKIKAEE